MSLETIFDVIKKIIDIAIVWGLFYAILKNIKNNVKLSSIMLVTNLRTSLSKESITS